MAPNARNLPCSDACHQMKEMQQVKCNLLQLFNSTIQRCDQQPANQSPPTNRKTLVNAANKPTTNKQNQWFHQHPASNPSSPKSRFSCSGFKHCPVAKASDNRAFARGWASISSDHANGPSGRPVYPTPPLRLETNGCASGWIMCICVHTCSCIYMLAPPLQGLPFKIKRCFFLYFILNKKYILHKLIYIIAITLLFFHPSNIKII